MSRERIVFETSGDRKAALVEQLDFQGESLAAWLEEQIDVTLATEDGDISDPPTIESLLDNSAALARLRELDWAFTDEDTRYLTHDLHPYPAKFAPQIPSKLIKALSLPGDVVFDPFGGSATTAVEAIRLRRRAISLDANPLSNLLGVVKTASLDEGEFAALKRLQAAVETYIENGQEKGQTWTEGLIAKHSGHIPPIPNIDKWFCATAMAELALLCHLIDSFAEGRAKDVARLAMSRIVTRVSNQDSETRYVAHERALPPTFTLRAFVESLRSVCRRLEAAQATVRAADAEFHTGDARSAILAAIPPSSVDLIVTSPPYPNATDYHLYHRFRLFWLGHDPRHLGAIEIGSHLKHQRSGTSFDEYCNDMEAVLRGCFRALQPGRFAVFVVGDAVFKGKDFSTSAAMVRIGGDLGFEIVGVIDRPIHTTKRSFSAPARRARLEQLVVLRRPNTPVVVEVEPPPYKMWRFETDLRVEELRGLGLTISDDADPNSTITLHAAQPGLWNLRRATFSTQYGEPTNQRRQKTWQRVLENGDGDARARKDPKYATHGIHAYKGKFYPQLAKSLLNAAGVRPGDTILDPYCGSGTVVLEGMLNGFRAYGADLSPMAAKIARAKTGILRCDPGLASDAWESLAGSIASSATFPRSLSQFSSETCAELRSWFPEPVLFKLNWLLERIRLFGDQRLVDFFEVIASSVIRDVSQQEPADLRIRRRKIPLADAPVLEMFHSRLAAQSARVSKFWRVEARQPGGLYEPRVGEGDSRAPDTFKSLGLEPGTVDCVVTSPPYATALPYIDTDRLSLLAILGVPSADRARVEESLTGSREIKRAQKQRLEQELMDGAVALPGPVLASLTEIHRRNCGAEVGFRRANMAALLLRYFKDMRSTLGQVRSLLRSGGRAYYVVGDSRTNAGGEWVNIETCRHTEEIAELAGFSLQPSISIDVTREKMLHMKNAITTNKVLVFAKS